MSPSGHPPFEELLSLLMDGSLDDDGRREFPRLAGDDPVPLDELHMHLEVSESRAQQQPLRRPDVTIAFHPGVSTDDVRVITSEQP